MRDWIWQSAIAASVAAVVLFTNLGGPRLWDRDEPRNAGCAREMLERGDWVTPVFNAELRTHKPVLLYWLIMSAYSVFGVSEFSARFWSAALAVGTVLCTYAMGRRMFGGRAGLWAGIALASSLMFVVAGRAATPDSSLIFFTTLAISIYVLSTFPPQPQDATGAAPRLFPASWWTAAAMYAAMGLAVLAKGPVGLVLPTAVIGMYLLVQRLPDTQPAGRWSVLRRAAAVWAPGHFLRTCWLMRPLTAILVALAVALPWYVWVGVRTEGEFLRGFFLEHNVGRAMRPMEGHHGSIFFYPGTILAGFFPWSVFALPLLIDAWSHCRNRRDQMAAYTLIACWAGVYVVLFSMAKTKLPSYVTPCYPALALAVGVFMDRWTTGQLAGRVLWRRLALGVLVVVGAGMLIGVPLAARHFLPGEEWLGVVGLIPLVGGAVCWYWFEQGKSQRATTAFATVAATLLTAIFGLIADRVDRHQQNHRLLAEVAQRPGVRVAALGLLEPSWVFYGRQPVHEMPADGSDVWMGTYAHLNGRWQPKEELGLPDLQQAPNEWLLITTDRHYAALRHQIPEEYQVLADTPYFLQDERLLLLGCPAPNARTAERALPSSGQTR